MANKVKNELGDASNCIYANDVFAVISDSIFDNGGVSVYANFADNSKLENITKNNDIFLMDNKNYIVSVENNGIKFNLSDNEIIVDNLPSRFDARDWGWTTPPKTQGGNDDCWAFATVPSLETALKKATGNSFNLSQNYVQKLQLKYSPTGDKRISLTGFDYSGLGYALSWIGALFADNDYDDRGMLVDCDWQSDRIHLQDALFIHAGQNNTIELIKRAVLKYGAVTVQLILDNSSEDIPSVGEDISIMNHNIHFISIIGWDDNYCDDDFAEGSSGAWMTKDSLNGFSTCFYDDIGLLGVDYYAIVPQNQAISYIFENDIDYHVNYQTDLTGLTGFDDNYSYYSKEFTSKYSELIGAVGTYFNDSGIDYSFDVYVNNLKVHTQSGVSEFAGFRTIILNKYIPVKAGDKFKVLFKNNNLPYQAFSRAHYIEGMSLISKDASTWSDISLENKTVCLKVYTVRDNTKIINNRDVIADMVMNLIFRFVL